MPADPTVSGAPRTTPNLEEVILHAAGEGIFGLDTRGRITFINPAAARMLGFTPDELLGRPSHATFHHTRPDGTPYPPEECPFYAAFRWGAVSRADSEVFRRRDGTPLPIEATSTPILRDGHLVGAVVIFTDISERLHLQAQFLQAQKMEAIGRLAGGVAHDFNNLLTAINGFSDLLKARIPPGHPHREMVEEIRHAGERATALTRQLLAFSRRQIARPRPLDLNALVGALEKVLRRLIGEDVELALEPAPGLWTVRADPGHIEQVVMNLAVNARDAMAGGGRMTIRTGNAEVDGEAVRACPHARPGPHAFVEVADTGTGMPPEVLARLFEPFFTTKREGQGTGLGLATVDGIVREGGGHVRVESEVGRGSTFRVYLPRCADPAVAGGRAAEEAPPRGGTETILVAEDSETVLNLVRRVLVEAGYRVLEAPDGEEACRVAASHDGPIHLVLLDTIMPRLNGPGAARRIAGARSGTRILLMSGYMDRGLEEEEIRRGGLTLLPKPFTAEALLREIRRVLDAPAPGAESR